MILNHIVLCNIIEIHRSVLYFDYPLADISRFSQSCRLMCYKKYPLNKLCVVNYVQDIKCISYKGNINRQDFFRLIRCDLNTALTS